MVVVAKALLHGFCHDYIPRKKSLNRPKWRHPKRLQNYLDPISQHSQRTLNTLPCQKETLFAKQKVQQKGRNRVWIWETWGEPRKKKNCYISLYWSFNMDPYIGLLWTPYDWWVLWFPMYPKQPGAFFSLLRCILIGHWQCKSWIFLWRSCNGCCRQEKCTFTWFLHDWKKLFQQILPNDGFFNGDLPWYNP